MSIETLISQLQDLSKDWKENDSEYDLNDYSDGIQRGLNKAADQLDALIEQAQQQTDTTP